jgi:hypothetical protein
MAEMAIRFGERGQVPQEERDRKVSESQRTTVLARDGNRCLVCRSRLDPCAHHLESHANGGRTEIRYLSSLCRRYEGFLNLTVDQKEGVVAFDRGGEPLKRVGGAAEALEDMPELMTLVARKSVPVKVINNDKKRLRF